MEIEATLADPGTYHGAVDAVTALNKRRAAIESRIAAAEARWLAATEALDRAE